MTTFNFNKRQRKLSAVTGCTVTGMWLQTDALRSSNGRGPTSDVCVVNPGKHPLSNPPVYIQTSYPNHRAFLCLMNKIGRRNGAYSFSDSFIPFLFLSASCRCVAELSLEKGDQDVQIRFFLPLLGFFQVEVISENGTGDHDFHTYVVSLYSLWLCCLL